MKKHYSKIDKKYHILSDSQVVMLGISGIMFGCIMLVYINL